MSLKDRISFKREKTASADRRDRCLPEYSWWTTKRKAVGSAIAAAFLGVVGFNTYRFVSDARRKRRIRTAYNNHVERIVRPYLDHDVPEEVTKTCVLPGRTVESFKDTRVFYGKQKKMLSFSATGSSRIGKPPCVLPLKGDQEIDLESRIRISRLEYGDIDSLLLPDTGLRLTPSFPQILSPDFSVKSVSINSKAIPLRYLESRPAKGKFGKHFYLNLSDLVEDGILSKEDFSRDLDISIGSYLDLESPYSAFHLEELAAEKLGPLSSYEGRFTRSDDYITSDHEDIEKIVSSYKGPDDVLSKLVFSLLVTDDALEYEVQEGRIPVVDALDSGEGDCSEYSGLFVTLARAFGIPARKVGGVVLDSRGRFRGYHAWAEALVPLEDGSNHWVLVEPTWADDKACPSAYIGYSSLTHLYHLGFDAVLEPGDSRDSYSVFQRHTWTSHKKGEKDGI